MTLAATLSRLLTAPLLALARQDPALARALGKLDGKRVGVAVEPPGLAPVTLAFAADGIAMEAGLTDADVVLRLSPGAALRFMGGADYARLMAEGSITVRGDVHVAARLRHAVQLVQTRCPDGLGTFTDSGYGQRLRSRVGEDLHRYLTDELELVVDRNTLGEFAGGVDGLRLAADRLAARIDRVQRHLHGPET